MERAVKRKPVSMPIVVPRNAIGKVNRINSNTKKGAEEIEHRRKQAFDEYVSWKQHKHKTSQFRKRLKKNRIRTKIARKSRQINRRIAS